MRRRNLVRVKSVTANFRCYDCDASVDVDVTNDMATCTSSCECCGTSTEVSASVRCPECGVINDLEIL